MGNGLCKACNVTAELQCEGLACQCVRVMHEVEGGFKAPCKADKTPSAHAGLADMFLCRAYQLAKPLPAGGTHTRPRLMALMPFFQRGPRWTCRAPPTST